MNLSEIREKAQALEARVRKDGGTDRDLAEAKELVNQYIDELERLEKTATVEPFLSGGTVADKVLSFWSYDD